MEDIQAIERVLEKSQAIERTLDDENEGGSGNPEGRSGRETRDDESSQGSAAEEGEDSQDSAGEDAPSSAVKPPKKIREAANAGSRGSGPASPNLDDEDAPLVSLESCLAKHHEVRSRWDLEDLPGGWLYHHVRKKNGVGLGHKRNDFKDGWVLEPHFPPNWCSGFVQIMANPAKNYCSGFVQIMGNPAKNLDHLQKPSSILVMGWMAVRVIHPPQLASFPAFRNLAPTAYENIDSV